VATAVTGSSGIWSSKRSMHSEIALPEEAAGGPGSMKLEHGLI